MKKPAIIKIDINTSSADDLTTVKGIGPGLAQKIINGRPYQTLDDLVKISGISDARLESLRPYLKITPPTSQSTKTQESPSEMVQSGQPIAKLGETEAFVFFEDQNDRQDAALIILVGFLIGLLILILRPSHD